MRDCEPKGAVLVDVADGRVAAVRRLEVDRARWLQLNVYVADVTKEHLLLAIIRAAPRPPLGGGAEWLTAMSLICVCSLLGSFQTDRDGMK